MKEPASIPSMIMDSSGRRALATPTLCTRSAISLGEKESNPKISGMVLLTSLLTHGLFDVASGRLFDDRLFQSEVVHDKTAADVLNDRSGVSETHPRVPCN